MNEKLMKIVERAVRSVRAGRSRKLAMREELLAHLTAIYDEERERHGDEAAALAAAQQRFGDPDGLARELTASLGWRDWWSHLDESWAAALDRVFGWQRGESFVRFAIRSGTWIAGLNLVYCLVMIAAAWLSPISLDPTFASFNRVTFTLFAAMAAGECAIIWAIPTTYRAFDRSAPKRPLILVPISVLGWTAVFVLISAAFWLGITLSVDSVLAHLPQIAFFAAISMPPLLLLAVWATHQAAEQNRPLQLWSRLELEE